MEDEDRKEMEVNDFFDEKNKFLTHENTGPAPAFSIKPESGPYGFRTLMLLTATYQKDVFYSRYSVPSDFAHFSVINIRRFLIL
jgi:hypothetical protein